MYYPMRRRFYEWNEIENLQVVGGPHIQFLPTGSRIVFDLAEGSAQRTAAVRAIAAANGYDVSMMGWFAIGAEELAGELERWRQIHNSRQRQPVGLESRT